MKYKINVKRLSAGLGIIAVLVFLFAIVEFFESRKELLSTLRNEAVNLTESLSLSFSNTIISNNEFENLLSDKLNAIAMIVSQKTISKAVSRKQLSELTNQFQVEEISIVRSDGKIITNTNIKDKNKFITDKFLISLKPIFSGEYEWLNLGLINPDSTDEQKYVFARIKNDNTCILIYLNSNYILDYRKKTGIGIQIKKIAENKNIEYIILQDADGIISASKGIKEISSIESDEFLRKIYQFEKTNSRLTDYDGRKVFEAIKPLTLKDHSKLLLRIGLSTSNIRSVQQMSMRRVGIIGIGIFILFSVLYTYIITRKGFTELKAKHKTITTYTDTVLENMADSVIAIDNQGIIQYFNRAASRITEILPQDAIGKNFRDVFKGFQTIIDFLENGKELKNTEIEIKNGKNQKKILEMNISRILDQELNPELSIVLLKDLTEKKHFQEQLERKEKLTAMGELAAGVAHEIRNPLNSINIIAQRIQKEVKPTDNADEFDKFMKIIRTEIARVNSIIKQFLDFARPKKLILTNGKITEIIEESISIVDSEAKLKNINIKFDFEEIPELLFDREQMKQVFINLLKNAMDSIKSDGTIECWVGRTIENDVQVKIVDTGSGIPKEILSKIFNLYFTTKEDGNGLGLSIVHNIITEHNANISIQSEVNIGTEVIINFPIIEGSKHLTQDIRQNMKQSENSNRSNFGN